MNVAAFTAMVLLMQHICHIKQVSRFLASILKISGIFADTKISVTTEDWKQRDEPLIKMRYQIGPQAELLAETGGELGYLDCVVQNLRTSMVTSSMANLADLVEDEKIPPFMPMVVRINNSDLTLRVRVKSHWFDRFIGNCG